MITFKFKTFDELTKRELYEILSLRAEVFVVEQHCCYLDSDGKDFEASHLMGFANGKLVAYLRLFLPDQECRNFVLGRVLTAKDVRSKGYGKQLVQKALDYCSNHIKASCIECSAQYYLKKFYESFGFEAIGEVYDDVGISHIRMIKHNVSHNR